MSRTTFALVEPGQSTGADPVVVRIARAVDYLADVQTEVAKTVA